MTDFDLTGVFPAMTTPFAPDERIDHETLAENAERLERAGVDGLVPVGSTGESATLTHDEHVEVVETVVEAVDVPIIAGAGSNSTREALELSRRSVDVGADGLLLISPYYNKPEQAGFVEHYRTIADAVDVPQIVYNVPSRTGRNIEPATVELLAGHENIAGYKAASGDLGQISEVVERTREEEFSVLSGDDALTLPVMSVGGDGTISVTANVEPERTVAMVEAAAADDYARARELHHELGPLNRQLFAETNPIPVKAAMEIRGYGSGGLRSPLTDLSAEPRAELEAILADLEESRAASLGLETAEGA
ncbi:4-hydroxy-tetrahydrodipicolinate synthase [Halogeometricum sp. S1BR25-6]|uniref:4-hydroxy-tetrahydrodipicolinate synthase n=1 Tax=Halogeometricum salsisoli TaxID=2950536 RepID=A0ABU2GBR9_9EURY|nr:4-hydroxy-tetrahydrodipicolinate synthase [Halogeometricum sp. S1BR25-6]MDS0298257.1 4-hydroxy-tetrahydrodipicolinate synthase [Halogeometricum sp. S1BR25-6]